MLQKPSGRRENGFRVTKDRFPGDSQRDSALAAIQQTGSECGFESGDLPVDRRLGQMEALAGATK